MAETKVGGIYYDLDLDANKFKAGLASASTEAKGFGSKLGNFFGSAEAASQKFALGLTALGAGFGALAYSGVKSAGSLETMTQGFKTLLGSAGKASEAVKMIAKDAAETPFELEGLTQANLLLTSVTKDAVKSEKFLLNVGKALAAMGKGQPELDRIIVNLQQIGAVGKASMMDIKQFAFAGVPIFEMLQTETGKTGEALEDFISEGKVTFPLLEKMFNNAGSAGGRFATAFTDQAGTFTQLMSNMKDTMFIFGGEIVKETGIFSGFKNALSTALGWLSDNKENIINAIKGIFGWMKDNMPLVIGIIVGGLTPAFIGLGASIWTAMAPLLPFIAAGAVIGLLLNTLAQKLGGWDEMWKKLVGTLQTVWNFISPVLMPMLNYLWATLQNIWQIIVKFWQENQNWLIPTLKVVAAIIGGLLVGSMLVAIGVIIAIAKTFQWLIGIISWVVDGTKKMINAWQIMGGTIANAIIGGVDSMRKTFERFFGWLGEKLNWAKDKLQKLNPFHRESPSLVDWIQRGTSQMEKDYGSFFGRIESMASNARPELRTAVQGAVSPQQVKQSQSAPNVSINVDMSGIMATSQSEIRDKAKLLIGALNEELRAKGVPQIGV